MPVVCQWRRSERHFATPSPTYLAIFADIFHCGNLGRGIQLRLSLKILLKILEYTGKDYTSKMISGKNVMSVKAEKF